MGARMVNVSPPRLIPSETEGRKEGRKADFLTIGGGWMDGGGKEVADLMSQRLQRRVVNSASGCKKRSSS